MSTSRPLRLSRCRDNRGLALLDVLLGMAIFSLIAVIAVQAMGQFRERAHVTQVTSDLKQVETAVHAALTEPGADVWSATSTTAQSATRDSAWINTSWSSGAWVLSAADLQRLGINLTNPTTTRVSVVPRAHVLAIGFGLPLSTFSPADSIRVCLHDTETQLEATVAEVVTMGSTPFLVSVPVTVRKYTSLPCRAV